MSQGARAKFARQFAGAEISRPANSDEHSDEKGNLRWHSDLCEETGLVFSPLDIHKGAVEVKLTKILRNGLAGVLIAAVPATASFAATRPNAAVPVAGSTAVAAAQYNDDDRQAGISWLALAAIGLAIGVALFLILDKDDKGEGSLSQG